MKSVFIWFRHLVIEIQTNARLNEIQWFSMLQSDTDLIRLSAIGDNNESIGEH